MSADEPTGRMPARARPDFRLFRGSAGSVLLRPWFDGLVHRAIMDWYFPLSRAWAAGLAARGSVEALAESLGPAAARWRKAAAILAALEEARRRYEDACSRWDATFFGDAPCGAELAAAEAARFDAAAHFMSQRGAFYPLRRSVPRVAWKIAGPDAVEEAQGARLADIAAAYRPRSPAPAIERSRSFDQAGRRQNWLRMPSPVQAAGDTAWARVFRPMDGPVRGAVVSLHGVLMEQEMWLIADPVSDLVERGFLVIRPEGPWHGRRRPAGEFGGEPIFARGILGFIELFEAWVAECAAWIGWARQETGGPVALGGISLGALTSQVVASVCGDWPPPARPDAALLITTTGDIVNGALRGSLAQSLAMAERLADAGWKRTDIHRWRTLVEPAAAPAIDPARIVMVLGDTDMVTPYEGGRDFAERWAIPPANLFVRHGGHFTASLGLYRDPAPLDRLAAVMETIG